MPNLLSAPFKLPPTGGIRRPHRFRPGQVALMEIRRYQRRTRPIIPPSQIRRVVKCIATELGFRINDPAINALQIATEDYLTDIFNLAGAAATSNGRETVIEGEVESAVLRYWESRYNRKSEFKAAREELEKNFVGTTNEVEVWEWFDEQEEEESSKSEEAVPWPETDASSGPDSSEEMEISYSSE